MGSLFPNHQAKLNTLRSRANTALHRIAARWRF